MHRLIFLSDTTASSHYLASNRSDEKRLLYRSSFSLRTSHPLLYLSSATFRGSLSLLRYPFYLFSVICFLSQNSHNQQKSRLAPVYVNKLFPPMNSECLANISTQYAYILINFDVFCLENKPVLFS